MAQTPPENKADRLALGVARGLSLRRAAAAAGVPETTARRRAAAPEFRARVAALRRQMIGRSVGRLAGAAAKAAGTLARLLGSADEDVRLKAARAVLADLMAVQSHHELSERLDALEAKLEGQAGATRFR